MPSLEDCFVGSLVGCAVGDALGGPAEEIPKHPTSVKLPVTEFIGGGWLNLKPGQVTDDTEMMLCMAHSLAEKQGFNPADMAQRFMEWFYDSPIGTGGTTRAAMARLKRGIPWYAAGVSVDGLKSLGNGSVMRCAPVGLVNYTDLDQLISDSYVQSLITHPRQECCDSAIFVNALIAGVLQGKNKEDAFVYALGVIKENDALVSRYRRIPQANPSKPSGKVQNTVEAAVNCFLTTNSFEEAVIKAVNLGGDADTTGAVTGAIAGALYGDSAILAKWKFFLVDRHERPLYAELCSLGRILYDLANKR